jgi:hypothetical protein
MKLLDDTYYHGYENVVWLSAHYVSDSRRDLVNSKHSGQLAVCAKHVGFLLEVCHETILLRPL